MKSVMFNYEDAATEESQDDARAAILALPGVVNVGRVSPQARRPSLRRMWFAEVEDDRADAVVDALRAKAEIRSADLPAPRALV